jgi:hypothetical protein
VRRKVHESDELRGRGRENGVEAAGRRQLGAPQPRRTAHSERRCGCRISFQNLTCPSADLSPGQQGRSGSEATHS